MITLAEVVTRTVPAQLLKQIASCQLIVYDLHDTDFEELEFVIQVFVDSLSSVTRSDNLSHG